MQMKWFPESEGTTSFAVYCFQLRMASIILAVQLRRPWTTLNFFLPIRPNKSLKPR